ncbi:uncharacterized protein KY384_001810 [Bacidia gigantensis]|uniref:uncharacterized protein n=1 Tax=Bacidia gigantensis TaxID=2732470 RepID=UPI001D05AFFC|nr:uncharacterized protein KY384_001810 [Bacidia gigantensis]KAG8533027.1 hypothetical protein KY384_001810 [Bacidia gigantensis]
MESPICVIDAQTFVDHIHVIKSWLYDGQLRLIVPSSRKSFATPSLSSTHLLPVSENVDQLYQKSIEPKPTPKETPRPKAPGKPTKKEYPTFDANPKIAKAYLARIQAGKDYETGDHGRPIYEKEENHGSVHFVQPMEQYSPWKDVDDYEEKTDLPSDRAESWAEKLRRKQNVVNGNAENKLAKGPVKPKLVAKTGADNSPWKVQKNAPTISVTEVPNALRPMMSCALWRVHESIHRNDENQVFVLTDQPSVRDVAKKLNINFRSTKELAPLIESQRPPVNLDQVGVFEQRLGVKQVEERRPNPLASDEVAEDKPVEGNEQQETDCVKDVLLVGVSSSKGINGTDEITDHSQDRVKNLEGIAEVVAPQLASRAPANDIGQSQNAIDIAHADIAVNEQATHLQHPASQESRDTVSDFSEAAKSERDGLDLSSNSELEQTQAIEIPSSSPEVPAPAANVTLRSFAEALTGNKSRKAPPAQASNSVSTVERSVTPARDTSPAIEPKVEPQHIVPADAPNEPEDSDGEVVVFQPKRLSAQNKPTQQRSRPSTPNVQAQQAPITGTPRSAPSKPQSTPKTRQQIPRSKPTNVSSHAEPAPDDGPAPIVIDPDAFGRGFAVNTNKDHRGSIRGARARHSPQASLFNAGPNPPRPSSSHRQPRSSPNRPSPRTSPPQAPRLPVQMERVASATQHRPVPPKAPVRPVASPSPMHQKQAPPKQPAHISKALSAGLPRQTPAARRPPMQSNGASSGSQQNPLPIGTGRPTSTTATDIRVQTLNANAPIFQPAGQANPPPMQSSLQQQQEPVQTPAKQPPIGSGRPKFKDSQPKTAGPAKLSPSESLAAPSPNVDLLGDLKLPASTSTPKPQSQGNELLQDLPTELSSLTNASHPAPQPNKPPYAQSTGMNGRDSVSRNFPNGNFRPQAQQSQQVQGTRPVKQSLFNPELDHTRAFQPEPVGARKSNVPDVHYVVKSGSTREQARGKGKLWIG